MIDVKHSRLVKEARLSFERAWPGTLAQTLTYCSSGVRSREEMRTAIKTAHKMDQIPWPSDDGIVIGEVPSFGVNVGADDPHILMFQRIVHKLDDQDHFRVVAAYYNGNTIKCDMNAGRFVRHKVSDHVIWNGCDPQERELIPDDRCIWLVGMLPNGAKAGDIIESRFDTACYLLNALVNLASPCGHRLRVTDREGFGTKAQKRITKGQSCIVWVNWDRLQACAKACGHPMADRERPDRIRAHPKYQWLRDAGFPCTDPRIPKDAHLRELLALELGVGYIWCPEVVFGADIPMRNKQQTIEVLTESLEIPARKKRLRKTG